MEKKTLGHIAHDGFHSAYPDQGEWSGWPPKWEETGYQYRWEDAAEAVRQAVSQWLPIETAEAMKCRVPNPRYPNVMDRQEILAQMGKRRVIAHWDDEEYAQRPRPHWRASSENVSWCRANQPTRWMPIPALPAAPGGQIEERSDTGSPPNSSQPDTSS